MKKLLTYFSFLSLLFLISGCEVEDSEQDFPFQLKLVVKGVLEANKPVQDIYVGRTMPISYKFEQSFANLTDASVAILYKDSLYILRHTREGLYSAPGLVARSGETYKLLVQWKAYFATAETEVPVIGTVTNAEVKTYPGAATPLRYIETSIRPYRDEAYAITWVGVTSTGNVSAEATEFQGIAKAGLQSYGDFIKVISDTVSAGIPSDALGYRVHAFDGKFYDYFITQNTNKVSDAVFGQPNSNVKWNIIGDGIGIFFGKADTVRTFN